MKKYLSLFVIPVLVCVYIAVWGNVPETGENPVNSEEVTSSEKPEIPQWHYYLKRDGLYRKNLNTEEIVKISNQYLASDIVIAEKWIYFNDNDCLYRMDNANRRELLLDDVCNWLSLKDDWLFYGNEKGVFKVKPNGNGKEQIIQTDCRGMVLSETFIFYIAYKPVDDSEWNEDGAPLASGQLHRTDMDGDNDVNLEVMVRDLSVYENMIYFLIQRTIIFIVWIQKRLKEQLSIRDILYQIPASAVTLFISLLTAVFTGCPCLTVRWSVFLKSLGSDATEC